MTSPPQATSGVAALLVGLLACGCTTGELPAPAPGQPLFVYVSPDPLGVNPFLLLGQSGIEAAAARHGARSQVLESEDPTSREENVRAAIDQGARLVVLLGFEFNDIVARLAPRAPEVDFLVVDQCPPERPANVTCAVFREYEASFLLGAAAARLSETRHIAAIGAADIPFLHRYTDGFAAGARHVDPQIRVSVRWVGGERPFSDPVRAKEQALALAAGGADHLFAAAAAGNFGIFEAAREKRFRLFAIDVNQCPEAPGLVVDNLLKRVDRVIVAAVDAILAGAAEPVLAFGIDTPGLAVGALDPAGDETRECRIRDLPELAAELRELARRVAAGEVGIDDPMGLL